MGRDTLEQLTLFDMKEEEYIFKEGEHSQECITCKKELPLKSFNTIGRLVGSSHKQGLKNGEQYWYLDKNCKSCDSIERRDRKRRRKIYPYPDKNYKCPICERDAKEILNATYRVDKNYNVYEPNHSDPWCLDHDHNTGEIRGWLCHKCNTGLGRFKDSISYLYRAIKYLLKGRVK